MKIDNRYFIFWIAFFVVNYNLSVWAKPFGMLSHFTKMNNEPRSQMVSFKETWQRYPAPDAILAYFRSHFTVSDLNKISPQCRVLSTENRTLLGESVPASGLPTIDNPNFTFIGWYLNCLTEFVKAEEGNQQNDTFASLSKSLSKECGLASESQILCKWTKLSQETKTIFIKQYIEKYIGPEEVLLDLEIAESEDAFAKTILAEVENYNNSPDSRFDFLRTKNSAMIEGLTIREASSIIKFLINITDNLQY